MTAAMTDKRDGALVLFSGGQDSTGMPGLGP